MSTTAGDGAPAPLTPTPSVRQRTIALESELLQHTCATVTGLNRGRASATSSGTGPGGGEAGPDTPPVLPAARGAEMNGDDASSEAPVVVNVALSDPRAPHLPQASRASPGGGASRGGGDRESAGSLGYADRDAAAAAAMKPTDGGASSPAPPPRRPQSPGGCGVCTSARAGRDSRFPRAGARCCGGRPCFCERRRRFFRSSRSRASRP